MSTIKIKLSFPIEMKANEREEKLVYFAKASNRVKRVNALEIKHYPSMSYILFENPATMSAKPPKTRILFAANWH